MGSSVSSPANAPNPVGNLAAPSSESSQAASASTASPRQAPSAEMDLATLRAAAIKSAMGKRGKQGAVDEITTSHISGLSTPPVTGPRHGGRRRPVPIATSNDASPGIRPAPLPSMPSTSTHSPTARSPIPPSLSIRPGSSFSGTSKRPASNEKEEGEISEDEESSPPPPLPPRKKSKSRSPAQPSFPDINGRRVSIASSSGSGMRTVSRVEQLREDKGKGRADRVARDSPGPVASAPPVMTDSEARQYMDVIRNLLTEGFTPDTLIRRGATAQYVSAVCEEIVEGSRRSKALWLEPREVRAVSEAPSVMLAGEASPAADADARSPSPDVDVLFQRQRSESMGSESSAEMKLIERMSSPPSLPPSLPPPPPPPIPRMLVPASSWTPTAQSPPVPIPPVAVHQSQPIPPPAQILSPRPVKIESYRPLAVKTQQAVAGPSVGTSPSLPVILQPPHPSLPPRPIAPVLPRPIDSVIVHSSQSHTQRADIPPTDHVAVPSTGGPLPSIPTAPPLSVPTAVPGTSARDVNAALAARTALLETRRKALESMKRKRDGAGPRVQNGMDVDMSTRASGTATPVVDLEKSIEQQVADLEKEVLDLQSADIEVPMDIDEPEEGEITPSPPKPETPAPAFLSTSASLPFPRSIRGVKRPNAEDLETRPTSLPSRLPPPKRRSVFARIAQNRNRLIINLDDDSSDSDSEDEVHPSPAGTATPVPIIAPGDAEREKLLAEKEESIRRLREQIAARMKAKEARLRDGVNSISRSDNESFGQAAAEVVAEQQVDVSAIIVEAAVEAMEIDEDASALMVVSDGMDEPAASADEPLPERNPTETDETTDDPLLPHAAFRVYQPLLPRYPQLASPALLNASLPQYGFTDPSPSQVDYLTDIDTALLGSIILTRKLRADPHLVICTAEAGGGSCADPSCEDLHLSRDQATDEDLAGYVQHARPLAQVEDILAAVRQARIATGSADVSATPLAKGKSKHKGKGKHLVRPEQGRLDVDVARLLKLVAESLKG